MIKHLTCLAALIAAPAFADVDEIIDTHILPGYAALTAQTRALSDAAQADCTASTLHPQFHAAYDAWIAISHIQFGPVEDQGLALAMSYWPDPKDRTGKAITRLSAIADPIVTDPVAFSEVSVAAQGFTALERLLFEPQDDPDYACLLTRAITDNLASNAHNLGAAWPAFAELLRQAGAEGNTRFRTPQEAQRALYTALSTGLEFLHDQRLGRPLGTFDKPRPHRAEARRSKRSLAHIGLSLAALDALATLLAPADIPATQAAFADARQRAEELQDPILAGVADPAKRVRIEALQRRVQDIRNAVNSEIGKPLGITAGFNALDGD